MRFKLFLAGLALSVVAFGCASYDGANERREIQRLENELGQANHILSQLPIRRLLEGFDHKNEAGPEIRAMMIQLAQCQTTQRLPRNVGISPETRSKFMEYHLNDLWIDFQVLDVQLYSVLLADCRDEVVDSLLPEVSGAANPLEEN